MKKNVTITLPELSDVLQSAIENKTLLTESVLFVFECTEHLKSLCERPTKKQYQKYCEMLIDKYPEFKSDEGRNPWVCRFFSDSRILHKKLNGFTLYNLPFRLAFLLSSQNVFATSDITTRKKKKERFLGPSEAVTTSKSRRAHHPIL